MKQAFKNTAPGFALALAAGLTAVPGPAVACGNEPYLGAVCAFGFNFCPQGYLPADGRLLSISQNTALFALLGTTYGGNGTTVFGLPDLRGRALVGIGQGPGLSNIVQGEQGGAESVTLTVSQLPLHSHTATTAVTVNATARAQSGAGNADSPTGNSLAVLSRQNVFSSTAPNVDMNASAISTTASATTTVNPAGGGQSFPNRSPYLGFNYCIATQGLFPPRP